MSFEDFLANLETSGWIEGSCLLAQIFLTAFITINLRKNANKFPIKQLSPICTMAALASFLLINIITVVARQIEQANDYYTFNYSTYDGNCGQCRIYQHTELQYLGIIYTSLRDFPLCIFSLKTLRVSICFVDLKNRDVPTWALRIFKNQWRIIAISFLYFILVFIGSLLNFKYNPAGISSHSAQLTFQLLCPKQSGVLDWVVTIFRYFMLIISYTLSIKTYKQLDFKRFLFLIFLLSNTQVVMRVVLLFYGLQNTTYHQFYYHSLLLNLLGTLLLLPYSNFNLNVNQPPGAAVLENFQAFINYIPGRDILKCFATFRDTEENCQKYGKCFEACLQIRTIKMEITLESSLITEKREKINMLLGNSEVVHFIDASQQIKAKIANQTLLLQDIKKLQKQLVQFCQQQIFKPWKKTFSRQYVEMQFKQNMIIDQKMKQMGIEIGS